MEYKYRIHESTINYFDFHPRDTFLNAQVNLTLYGFTVGLLHKPRNPLAKGVYGNWLLSSLPTRIRNPSI